MPPMSVPRSRGSQATRSYAPVWAPRRAVGHATSVGTSRRCACSRSIGASLRELGNRCPPRGPLAVSTAGLGLARARGGRRRRALVGRFAANPWLVRGALAASLGVLLVGFGLRAPRGLLFWLVAWLSLLGFVRRIVSGVTLGV